MVDETRAELETVLAELKTLSDEQRTALLSAIMTGKAKAKKVPLGTSVVDRHRASYNKLFPFLLKILPDVALWWDGWVAEFEVISETGDLELTLINGSDERERKILHFTLQAKLNADGSINCESKSGIES